MSIGSRARLFARRWRRPIYEMAGSDRYSHLALNDLDRKLKKYLDFDNGTFIEAGANDGLKQSNTYWFERFRGWRGLLIEPLPQLARACRRNRPKATVFNWALVATPDITNVCINTADLMAFVSGAFGSDAADSVHREQARDVMNLGLSIHEIVVPARTLESVLDEIRMPHIDFFSLDVEGYEVSVLQGLNINRYKPRFILVETRKIAEVQTLLGPDYTCVDQLSHHDYLLESRTPR